MPWMNEFNVESLEKAAAEASRWLASPAAGEAPGDRRERVSGILASLGDSMGREVEVRMEPLEAPPVDDGSPMATFLTLRGGGIEAGVLVLYGVHTALVMARAGVPGCRMARLDPGTGAFTVTETMHRMPGTGAVELLGGRTVGAALYRVLLTGGAVMGPGLDPDARFLDPHPVRDHAASLLLEAAGGGWISPSTFGSTRVLGELAAHRVPYTVADGAPPPSMAEPLFGSRGLFRP